MCPHGTTLDALTPLIPVLASYTLSFVYLGIYWNNHHHMLRATKRVTGAVQWANLHLLFWLSLVPFSTAWMGENHFAATPTAVYGTIMLMAAVAYFILQGRIIKGDGPDSVLARAIGSDWKGKLSLIFYLIAVPAAFFNQWISQGLYVTVAVMWLVPDQRIERVIPDEIGDSRTKRV